MWQFAWQNELVIVDHKAFPGVIQPDGERLLAFAAQSSLYAQALRGVHGDRPVQIWLHQPIAGRMIRVEIS